MDHERAMKAIQKAMVSRDFQTKEELEQFLIANLADKPIDEVGAMLEQSEPQTDLARAEDLMANIPEEALPNSIRRTAKQALAISQDCLSAWLELGIQEEDEAKALTLFDQGIERGRIRFKDLIDSLDEEYGMWGWIEARDFMRLLQHRALALEALGELEQAISTYQEMLELNPGDNQGIRCDLLRLLMIIRRLEEGRALLGRFPKDTMPEMAYGRAFLSFIEAMDRSEFEMPAMDTPDAPQSPSALMKQLGAEFNTAKNDLKKALKTNPFVPMMMTHPQILGVEIEDMVISGGPFEAVVYAQRWGLIWFAATLPFVAISAIPPSDPMKLARSTSLAIEFAEVIDQLEELDDIPWWERMS